MCLQVSWSDGALLLGIYVTLCSQCNHIVEMGFIFK